MPTKARKPNAARARRRALPRTFRSISVARTVPPYSITQMNSNRADWALGALTRFKEECRTHSEDDHTNISDLIADLLHLSTQRLLIPSTVLLRALNHFDHEATGNED